MHHYIKPIWFRVELTPPTLMNFIGSTPPEAYCLVPMGGLVYYGIAISDDVVEYLTNEFLVKSLEIVSSEQIKKLTLKPGCKIWGNADLIDY
jgi:hypothetical protein